MPSILSSFDSWKTETLSLMEFNEVVLQKKTDSEIQSRFLKSQSRTQHSTIHHGGLSPVLRQ